jgi:4,5-DOPA dioxygenase extradiol
MQRQPALFVSHGAPTTALETESPFARDLRAFCSALAPKAIIVVSAHWETDALRVTASERPQLIYDFGGFSDELYRVRYPCPGDPQLAREIARRTGADLDVERGLDHGAWTPLVLGFPRADVPVVQLSLLRTAPERLAALGETLSPLREEGVLLLCSGGAVHNLRDVRWGADTPPDWAKEFDSWLREKLEAGDRQALFEYRKRSPLARLAAPTPEHLHPLFIALGAARPGDRLVHIHEGFQHGSISLRTFAYA